MISDLTIKITFETAMQYTREYAWIYVYRILIIIVRQSNTNKNSKQQSDQIEAYNCILRKNSNVIFKDTGVASE